MPVTCPICSKPPSRFLELAVTHYSYELSDGKFIQFQDCNGFKKHSADVDGELGSIEPLRKIQAECDECDHQWMLRKHKDIDSLVQEHGVTIVREDPPFLPRRNKQI
jgi:hypothetical protein